MLKSFEKLNDQETELMLKAPILVCILIAGADGNIDNKEIKEAITIARKQTKSSSELATYFTEVSQDFEDKLKILIQSYPYEPSQRSSLIMEELSGLNKLWSKLDKGFSKSFYDVLKSIADKIANSSGGLLGIHSVGSEEAQYIQLAMIKDPAR